MIEATGNTNESRVFNDEIGTANNLATMVTNEPSFLASTGIIYGSLIELSTITAQAV